MQKFKLFMILVKRHRI